MNMVSAASRPPVRHGGPILGILILAACAGCTGFAAGLPGSGTAHSETRTLDAFKQLQVDGAYEVEVTCQQPERVDISGDDNLVPEVKTSVQGDTLRVYNDKSLNPKLPLVVKVSVPTLTQLTVHGAVDGKVHGVKTQSFSLDVSGAGSVELDGVIDNLAATLSGVASVKALGLHSQTVHVTLSGAGSAEVYALDTLDAQVSGAGSIVYAGNPKTVHQTVSGVGTVKKM